VGERGRGWVHAGEMTQVLYAHMNNKAIKKIRVYQYLPEIGEEKKKRLK
jgi:uncharacterized membrane protein